MSMNFSTAAQRALSDTWSKLIEGGTGDAWLEFYDRKMPKNPDDPVTTQRLLARLHVEPQTMRAEPANAIASGDASCSRLLGINGRAVTDFSVSTKDGDGWSFNTVGIRKGGPVSVFARMSIFSPQARDDDSAKRTAMMNDATASMFGSDAVE